MKTLSLQDLYNLAVDVLVASDTSQENAAWVADALVAAEADGLMSHGACRLPFYADQALSGKVAGQIRPQVTQPARAAIRVDARDGFAYPAIRLGMDEALALVREMGVAAVAVANSHHFGAAGYHVERPARQGMIALAFGNAPAAIAPWGGSTALFGTNPIAFACPRVGSDPLVIDLSLSKAARGKVLLAAQKGEPIPGNWALDVDGRPTTDAAAAMAGTMLPAGEVKGAALAMMVELMAAALTGSNFSFEASSFFTSTGGPPRVGQFFLLLDPCAFGGEGFTRRAETLFEAVLAQPGTRLPGDRRLEERKRAQKNGIALPVQLYEELVGRCRF